MSYATFRRTHDGKTYVPDDRDLDTLARALWGEEGSKPTQKALAATAWTWMNRYMLHPGQPRNWPKLEDLIKGAFSTDQSGLASRRQVLSSWRQVPWHRLLFGESVEAS